MVRKFLEDIFRRKLDVLHSARVVHTLYQQQKEGKYCDLKVLVEDQQYFVHRCVLASASSQLDAQINGLDTIQLVGVTNYGFERLLEILYSGKMSKVATVDSVHFHQIVSAADALNAESVIEYCARERGDLMKVVLDQPETVTKEQRDEAVTTTSVSETTVDESLTVDSPMPVLGNVTSMTDSGTEPAPDNSEQKSEIDVVNWEVKVKQEPQETIQRTEIGERIAAEVEVTDGESNPENQFMDVESSVVIPGASMVISPTGEIMSNLGSVDSPGEGEDSGGLFGSDAGKSPEKIETSRISSMMSGASGMPRGFQCSICKRMFSTSQHLKVHMKKHIGGNKPFRCEVCGMRFSYHLTLMNHMKLHDQKKFSCHLCGKEFKMNKNLQIHLRTSHGKDLDYTPTESQFSFQHSFPSSTGEGSSRRKSAPAKRVSTGEVIEESNVSLFQQEAGASLGSNRPLLCGTSELDELKTVAEHTQADRDGKYPCALCGKGFSRRWNLKCHVLTHAENRSPRQRVKIKPMFQSKNIAIKNPNLDSDSELPFPCSLCGKSFQSLSNLRRHSTIMHRKRDPVSSHYSHPVGDFSNLMKRTEESMKAEQSPKIEQELSCWCEICGRGFKRVRNLRSHMETHTGGGYECHVCGRTFAQKDGLNGHLWVHGGLGGSKPLP